MSKCVKCSKEVTGKFCSECGTPVPQTNEQPIVNDEYIVGKAFVAQRHKDKGFWALIVAGVIVAIGIVAIVIATISNKKEIERMEKANYEKAMQGTPVDPKSAKDAMQGIVDKYTYSSSHD